MNNLELPESQIAPDDSNIAESQKDLGSNALQAARQVYAQEVKSLEEKASLFKNLRNITIASALPASVYVVGKYLGLDIEKTAGIDMPKNADAAIRMSWATAAAAGSSVMVIQTYLEQKLDYLKDKFGMLASSGDEPTA